MRSKEVFKALRKKVVALYNRFTDVSKYIEISHATSWKIVYKQRTFKTTANMLRSSYPSKFNLEAQHKMVIEVSKKLFSVMTGLRVALLLIL